MRINRNLMAISAYRGVRQASDSLYSSMRKLSSGERVNRPGDAPADFGISETLRFQIRNSGEASRNIEKARSMVSSADSWMQVTHDILARMSELSIGASDSSKSEMDRESLNTEFIQLKEEISRISREAKFNGVQIAGHDQMLSYDQDAETFVFSQLDGDERYNLNVKVMSGLKSDNNIDFQFDNSKDFTLSQDGRYIFYVDSSNQLSRYDIEKGTLARDTADTELKGMDVDAKGRLWYARETATGSGAFSFRQQDINSWAQDTDIVSNTDVTDMASTEFSVYNDRVYYLDTTGDIVSRSLSNFGDVNVELASTDLTFASTAGQFSISEDGQFMADVTSPGTIRVTNLQTQHSSSYSAGAAITVADLSFSADNRDLGFVDSVTGAIHRVTMLPDERPRLSDGEVLHLASGRTGFAGLSFDGGSHRANFRVHDGPGAVQETFVVSGDVRLQTLGLTKVNLGSLEEAKATTGMIMRAIDKVSVQRARLGAQESRMSHTYEAIQRYHDSLDTADAVIRDVDMAEESANLAESQVMQQAAMSLLAQANSNSDSIIRLLQSR